MKDPRKPAILAAAICMATVSSVASAEKDLIDASDITGANISNGLNVFGQVEDVILDESSTSIEYVLFSTSDVFRPTRSDRGFVSIDNVDFTMGAGGTELELVVEDTDAQREPEQLMLTRAEAEHRLLSNVLDESVEFANQEFREIDEVLVNPDTGKIEYVMVEMNADNFFDWEVRAIPADELVISRSGEVSTSASLSDVRTSDRYQLSAL